MIKWINGAQVRTPTPGQPVPIRRLGLPVMTASDPVPEEKPEEKTEVKEAEANG